MANVDRTKGEVWVYAEQEEGKDGNRKEAYPTDRR